MLEEDMKNFSEIIDYIVDAGGCKTDKKLRPMLIQGILAGMFVAMGAIGYYGLVANTVDPGIGKFLGALIKKMLN